MATITIDYRHTGPFNRPIFVDEFTRQFSRGSRYNAAAMPDMLLLLGMIEADRGITDVRQAAYILATVMWETTYPLTFTREARNRKGEVLVDKAKNPIIIKEKKWLMTMAPVDEVGKGKGRRYHEPVKVKALPDGTVRITEQDGDQFLVLLNGSFKPLTRKAQMGTRDGGPASKVYDLDDGTEQAYFGRGYVQLTWWSNYAQAGVAIDRGLDLLIDPELVKRPEIAYALMSHGMRTGEGFANRRHFGQFFTPAKTDYKGARRMVNGSDHASDIAAIAKQFEAILLKAAKPDAPAVVPGALP